MTSTTPMTAACCASQPAPIATSARPRMVVRNQRASASAFSRSVTGRASPTGSVSAHAAHSKPVAIRTVAG
jgi:hypothetical protein